MKKSFLSLFLVLSLIVSVFSFPAVSSAQGYLFLQNIEEYNYSGTTLSVTAKVTNNSGTRTLVNGYAAVYSSDGILKSATTQSFYAKSDAPQPVIYDISNYTYSYGDYIKLFLWDDANAPLADCVNDTVKIGAQIEGVVTKTYLSSPNYNPDEHTISILITKSASPDYQVGDSYDFVPCNTVDTTYLGYSVTATVDKNADGDDAILSIAPTEGKNTLITISTDLIDQMEEDMICYYPTESSKLSVEAEIQSYVVTEGSATSLNSFVINGFNYNYCDFYDFVNAIYYINEISLLDNNNDGGFEFVFANIPTEEGLEFVVADIHIEDGLYTFESEDYSCIDLDTTDEYMYITVIKDGSIVTVDKIAIGDTITCLDSGTEVLTVYVSSTTVTGIIDEINDDEYCINGNWYKLSPFFYEIYSTDECTFHINAFGHLAYADIPQPKINFYYIIDSTVSEGIFGDDQYLVKFVDALGTEHILPIQNKWVTVYYDYDYSRYITAEETYDCFINGYTGLVSLDINEDGEIFNIYFPGCEDFFTVNDRYEFDAEDCTKSYNKTRNTYGTVTLSDETVIFNVDSDENVSVSTVGELFVDDESYSFIAYGEEDLASVLVTFGIYIPEKEEDEPVIGESEYMLILDAGYEGDDFYGTSYLVLALSLTSSEQIYEFIPNNIDIYTEGGVESGLTAEEAFDNIYGYYGIAKVALTEDRQIAAIYFPGCEDVEVLDKYSNDANDKSASYNQSTQTYGTVKLQGSTPIFNTETDSDAIGISTVEKVFTDGSSYSFIAYGSDVSSPDVIVTIDAPLDDDIIESEPVVEEEKLAYLLNVADASSDFYYTLYMTQTITSDGITTYPIRHTNVDIYSADGIEYNLTEEDVYEYLADYTGMVKIALTADDEICAIYLPGCEEFTENDNYINDAAEKTKYYNATRGMYGSVTIDCDTVLYCVDSSYDNLEDGITVLNASQALQDGYSYSFVAYGNKNEAAQALLVLDPQDNFNPQDPVMVVTKVSTIVVNHEESIRITGIQSGETVQATVNPDEDADVEIGNVIMYSTFNGLANNVRVLFTSSDYSPIGFLYDFDDITTDLSDEYVSIHCGEITEKTSKTLTLDDEFKFYFADEVNVIVVDYTGRTTAISAGTLSSVKKSFGDYKRTAFVKTLPDIEDEISDIVVFIEPVS